MTLYEKLQKATSEEDVKDAYIKALGLKEYQKNLIDIQTKEIWFEAKDSGRQSRLNGSVGQAATGNRNRGKL
jgi:hypothetical protein